MHRGYGNLGVLWPSYRVIVLEEMILAWTDVCSTNVNIIFVLRSETRHREARAENNAVEEAGGGPWLEPEKSVASKTDVGQVVSTATGARHSTGVGWSLAHLKLVMFPGHQFVKCFSVTHGHCGMTCSDLSPSWLPLFLCGCCSESEDCVYLNL